jgi:hypothetical protein
LTSVVYEKTLVGLQGVWETQGLVLIKVGLGNVGVRNLISSFEITTYGSKGIKLVLRNLALVFSIVIDWL